MGARGKLARGKRARGKLARGKQARGKPARGKPARGKQARGKQARGKQAKRKAERGKLARGKQAKGKQARGKLARVKEKARRKKRMVKSHKVMVKRSQERLMHRKSKNQSTINCGASTCLWNKYWRNVSKEKSRTNNLPSLSASNDKSTENSKFMILKHFLYVPFDLLTFQ